MPEAKFMSSDKVRSVDISVPVINRLEALIIGLIMVPMVIINLPATSNILTLFQQVVRELIFLPLALAAILVVARLTKGGPASTDRAVYWIVGLIAAPLFIANIPLAGSVPYFLRANGGWIIAAFWLAAAFVFADLFNRKSDQRRNGLNLAISTFGGGTPAYVDVFDNAKKAIALGRAHLLIINRSRLLLIPFSIIRGWEYRLEGHDREVVYGIGPAVLAASIQASGRNAAAKKAAEQASGLFVHIADVDFPTVQFQSADIRFLERWHEILTQALADQKVA